MKEKNVIKQSATKYIIKGNESLFLNNPKNVWFVESGSLVIFAILIKDNQPQGNRHYLFTVYKGEILLGVEFLPDKYCLIAVALENTIVYDRNLTNLLGEITAQKQEAIIVLELWLHHWNKWMSNRRIKNTQEPTNIIIAEGNRYLSLISGQSLQSPKNSIAWINISKGEFDWMGLEQFKISEKLPIFPLLSEMWLNTNDSVDLLTINTPELENSQDITNSLRLLHLYLLDYLSLLIEQQKQEELEQFKKRNQLNHQIKKGALRQLTEILNPQDVSFFQQGSPLLMAVGAVARVLKITVKPPSQSEDLSRVKDPLDAITRASQFQTRRVLLDGKWWKQENGPLLAYKLQDDEPVALLPYKTNQYLLFDPIQETKTLIDEQIAETLSPEAYMFYRPLPENISGVLEVFQFGVKGYEKDIFIIGLLGVLGTLMGMVTPEATNLIINNAIPDSDKSLLLQIGLALLAASFGRATFQLAQSIFSLRVESAADGNLQPAVWDRLLKLSPPFFRKYATGDLLVRLLAVGQIRSQLSGATQRTLLTGVFALLNLGLMFIYSQDLAIVAMGITLVLAIVTVVSSTLLVRQQREQEELDGKINGLSIELINGVSKLRVAAAEERAFGAWVKQFSIRTKMMSTIQRINDSITVVTEALPLMSSVLLFWFAIYYMQKAQLEGGITLNAGTFLAFNSAFGTFFSGVTTLSVTITDILEIVPFWERAQPIVQGQPESNPESADPGRLTGHFTLDHVTFRYKEDGPLILEDVSISAKPGEFIALVGPSGCGKSTIMRLLLGFEVPLSGTVYYEGQDLAGLNIQAVRRQLGVVLQNGIISQGTLFESLTSGALVTLDEAWEAARMAGFAEDIEQMPMGMHTVISEGGTNLSGGQRQRLLIARSLVLKPKIMFLDEATSALDNRTQAIVTESLDKMNATRVVVAHRLSTIQNADRIYVLETGRLVQVGTFDSLLKEEGLFARLAARQLD